MSAYPLISLRLHAWSDAIVLTAALLTPWLGGFAGANVAALAVWGAVALAWGMNLLSQYPLGVVKVLPMRLHSLLELGAAPVFIVLYPYLFSNVPVLPWLFPAVGIVNLATNLLTDYRR
jgi:uncharacterized membrane protein